MAALTKTAPTALKGAKAAGKAKLAKEGATSGARLATTVGKAKLAAKGASGGGRFARTAGKTTLMAKGARRSPTLAGKAVKARAAGKGAKGGARLARLTGRRRRPSVPRPVLVVLAAGGAIAVFLRDPGRRNAARGRAAGVARRRSRPDAAERLNDPALARKVESEIFRDPDAPKGSVDVNVEEGVVYLRGEVESQERVQELGEEARKVEGVRGVENLLHTPGEPAKTKG